MFTIMFFKALAERAVTTAGQAFVLYVGAGQFNVLDFDWSTSLGFAAGGAALSIAKGLAAYGLTGNGPSLTNAETIE